MYRILVLCIGFQSSVQDSSLMYRILVLCIGFQSYVQDYSLMYWVLVLCIGYTSYVLGTSLMYRILVLCIGYQSYVLGTSLTYLGLVLCITVVHIDGSPTKSHKGPPPGESVKVLMTLLSQLRNLHLTCTQGSPAACTVICAILLGRC